MARIATTVSVGTSATKLNRTSLGDASLTIRNNGAATIFVGGSDVTVASGFPLKADEVFSEERNELDYDVYGIVATGTVEARVMITGRN